MKTIPSVVYQKLLKMGLPSALALSAFIIIPFEGEVKKDESHVAYYDPVNIPTACWGQTGHGIKVGVKYSEDECIAFLYSHLKSNGVQLEQLLDVKLQNDYQYAALIDFIYNSGSGNLSKSSMLKLFNEGRYDEACDELSKWVFANKVKLRGLVRRREVEKAYCLGNPPDDVENIYEASKDK